ncbi:hypothetical protein O3P69_019850, partial [Scylla paramamosain]
VYWPPVYLEEVYLVTALVPSETACFASSPGRRRRTAVWISRAGDDVDGVASFLLRFFFLSPLAMAFCALPAFLAAFPDALGGIVEITRAGAPSWASGSRAGATPPTSRHGLHKP